MNAQEFCYWLKGYVELNGTLPTQVQWLAIQDHLNLVFNKVTPQYMPPIKTNESGLFPISYRSTIPNPRGSNWPSGVELIHTGENMYPLGVPVTC